MSNQIVSPQTKMMHHGYSPRNSSGAVKMPIYQTSTYAFENAEQGERYFRQAYGLEEPGDASGSGMLYSRINHPNAAVVEARLTTWDGTEDAVVFQSGMAAISTVFLTYLRPGDVLLFSEPAYGGTDHFIRHLLPEMGITSIAFDAHDTEEDIIERLTIAGQLESVVMIFAETPANPTSELIDIAMCRRCADRLSFTDKKVKVVVDNTYLGPLWSKPTDHGADLVVYSLTKYVGGHSDLIAGAVLGDQVLISDIEMRRGLLGNIATPYTCWLILRSMETLELRLQRQLYNARIIAEFLQHSDQVIKVFYPGLLKPGDPQYQLFCTQYLSAGAMISFEIDGTKESAFTFLNNLKIFKLAVSLGSTESLAQHPFAMTHAGMDPGHKKKAGISENLIRLSIGIEAVDDLIDDLKSAFLTAAREKKLDHGQSRINHLKELPKSKNHPSSSPVQLNS